jgi:hypothetical protein
MAMTIDEVNYCDIIDMKRKRYWLARGQGFFWDGHPAFHLFAPLSFWQKTWPYRQYDPFVMPSIAVIP